MDFQAYNKILICEDDLKNRYVGDIPIGYEFKIKYPSYRGTFLSCIEALEFKLDGKKIPEEQISIHVNGKDFLIGEISECFKEYWFVREPATVCVLQQGGLTAGKHELDVYMKHRVPYTGYFGEYLVLESHVIKQKELEDTEVNS
jgi:hypothetical protein